MKKIKKKFGDCIQKIVPKKRKDKKVWVKIGYKCYLRVTERTDIQRLLKREIKSLTRRTKEKISADRKKHFIRRKAELAKIFSKLEYLFPDEA